MPHYQAHAARVADAGAGVFLSGQFSSSAGSRPFKLYLPPTYSPDVPVPLLVALHGCTQNPDNFASGTRFNLLADAHTFLVLYPQQTSRHHSGRCWNWYDPLNQQRGSGEPVILAGMVDEVCAQYAIDTNRIFLTGMSAGGAMAVIMGVCYPDYFAAIGVHSGLEYGAARGIASARIAQIRGGPDPDLQGKLAFMNAGPAARVLPVIVFHGARDYRVAPINGEQVIRQFARFNDYADDGLANNSITALADSIQTGRVPGGYSYIVSTYTAREQVVMQKYLVDGLGHAWSGGSAADPATFTDPRGPDASAIMWDFFVTHPKTSLPALHFRRPGEIFRAAPAALKNILPLRKRKHDR
jgi:poly(hydroxyalkanoate) depolymerase family esterase